MKAIIFDIDGTLIESTSVDAGLYFSSVNEILGSVIFRKDPDDYEHVTDSGILTQVLNDNGHLFDNEIAASIKAVFIDRIKRHIETAGPFRAIDGAIEFVEMARASHNRRVAIATGGWRESALLKLQSAGFDINGVPVVTSDDSPFRVEIMRSALAMIGDQFESVTYFGDGKWDQRACRSLGWNFVAVGPDLDGVQSYGEVEL